MAESSYPDALPAQYRLHWYTLERVLGQGGFGITYLARDTNLDQPVAIKEYLPVDVATRRADATVRSRTDDHNERYRWGLERFIREARTLARFDHPNIVRVHSVFEFNNTAYMVMRFEEGENFAALLERRRTLAEADLMRILLPIIDGLELVHNAGFIHRDIKPDNIHIRADGTPVLLDFGSARLALGHARTVTILVAPGYAPFEQYYSTGENQGPWTDIYGLGATCYRAISGIAPMDAIARSKGILGSTREILVPAGAIGSGRYAERLLKAIDHALEFSEKDRPQTLAQWRAELSGTAAAPARAAPPTAPAAKADRWSGARGPVVGATIGAVVAVAAVALWLQPGNEQQQLREALLRSEADRQRLEEKQRLEQAAQQKAALERSEREAKRQEEQKIQEAATRQREDSAAREAEARRALEAAQKRREEAARVARAKPAPVPAPKPIALRARTEVTPATPQAAPTLSLAKVDTVRPETAPVKPAAAEPAPAAAPAKDAAQVAAAPPERTAAKGATDDRSRALQGDPAAQLKLGEMYENGRGVPQNNFQAYYWYSAAVRGGNAGARVKKEQMAARLQPAEIQQAEKLVERLARPAK
ncbi:MAG: hypothetical protein EPO27_01865 [Betaproteobacteria bacterium]|nr:MAG: hypothetical protein EPO27_01865 [Betaproteobacteria bacterium]